MALIVEGNMPTCCGFCCECLGGGSDAYYCNRAKRQISEVMPPYDKRMEWCPILGEIPDRHGRLIDVDALPIKDEWSLVGTDVVWDAPTVIEATKG